MYRSITRYRTGTGRDCVPEIVIGEPAAVPEPVRQRPDSLEETGTGQGQGLFPPLACTALVLVTA